VSKQTDDKTLVVVFDSDGPSRRAPQGGWHEADAACDGGWAHPWDCAYPAHRHRDWTQRPPSAPGLGSPLPRLQPGRACASSRPHLHRDCPVVCRATGLEHKYNRKAAQRLLPACTDAVLAAVPPEWTLE
jgi:hypothetical protein